MRGPRPPARRSGRRTYLPPSLDGRMSQGLVVTPPPVTVEQPFAPGPREHFHQLAVALIVPAPMLSMPTSPKNELKCASIPRAVHRVDADVDALALEHVLSDHDSGQRHDRAEDGDAGGNGRAGVAVRTVAGDLVADDQVVVQALERSRACASPRRAARCP